jgi:pimeloyl-ACP methyl ester carboxylesterase
MLLSFVVAIGVLLQTSNDTSSISQALETTSFVHDVCPFVLPNGLVDGDGITCGYLTAPLVHGQGGPETVRLAVAKIRSLATEPAAEPLVLLLGGPGQEVETILPAFASDAALSYRSLLERRDVLLLEQRGVGYSEPSLACPFDAVGGVAVSDPLAPSDDVFAAFAGCAAALRSSGINLEAFDSIQSAADIDVLRGVLKFD